MKVIIAGSRDLEIHTFDIGMAVKMSGFGRPWEVVSGRCLTGIDAAGERWAREVDINVIEFPADWKAHGKAAGPIRNRAMAEYADALIAIYRKGKLTPGTKNMISEARKRGLKIYEHVI